MWRGHIPPHVAGYWRHKMPFSKTEVPPCKTAHQEWLYACANYFITVNCPNEVTLISDIKIFLLILIIFMFPVLPCQLTPYWALRVHEYALTGALTCLRHPLGCQLVIKLGACSKHKYCHISLHHEAIEMFLNL